MNIGRLQEEMDRAVAAGVFPGGVLLAARGSQVAATITAGRLEYSLKASPVRTETIYDLASLTKVLSTAILTMIFLEQGRFGLESSLKQLWPGRVPPDKRGLTLTQLLSHTSGLPAWRPYFEVLNQVPIGKHRTRMAELILEEPLESEPGKRSEYSDLNFILLGLILEEIAQARQEQLFEELVARPLGLKRTGYRPMDRKNLASAGSIAPTEDCPDRGGVLKGEVHDKNAWALSGVAGHAGLFGTAGEVWRIMASLRASFRHEPGSRLVLKHIVQSFWLWESQAISLNSALGFDRPVENDSAAGHYFSRASVGHLGFTGASLWYDPDQDLTVILLTNRVHPSSTNEAIKKFRPFIHDLVFEKLVGKRLVRGNF
ncbi:MAG: beta-lactamase family protein [Deltaproteobacteria bacterium]|nr:beta-lactamase family protein [Deltaproteobacteria bacterium]